MLYSKTIKRIETLTYFIELFEREDGRYAIVTSHDLDSTAVSKDMGVALKIFDHTLQLLQGH